MNWLIVSIMLLQGVDFSVLEKKSAEAREILKKESTTFKRAGKGKNSRIVSRDILLAVGSLSADEIKVIRLVVNVPKSTRDRSFKFKVATPGFDVERISGAGITRLIFKVTDKDTKEELVVWDSRHLHLENQRTSPRDLFYFPYSKYFLREEVISAGSEFLSGSIEEVRQKVCQKQIMSRALPEKPMCLVYTDIDKYLYALGASEQTDDGEFSADSENSLSKFLVHVGRNRENAFYYSISEDGARGLMQFMNKKGNMTYKWVRDSYPEAGLIPDFEKGTANFQNSLLAAWLLFDLNISKISGEARNLILINPKLGGFLGASSHNAGWKRGGKRLFVEIVSGKITAETKDFSKSGIPRETKVVLKKFSLLWDKSQERQ